MYCLFPYLFIYNIIFNKDINYWIIHVDNSTDIFQLKILVSITTLFLNRYINKIQNSDNIILY